MAHRRAKSTNLVHGGCMKYECGYLGLEDVKVIFGSFGVLFSKLGHIWTVAHCRAKLTKIWDLVCVCVCGMYVDTFNLECVKVILR